MVGPAHSDDACHYCIFCGSSGVRGSVCSSHNHVRGQCTMRPLWSFQMFGTFMGRKLAYVSWPWVEDLDAPYVPAPGEWRKTSWPPREYVLRSHRDGGSLTQ